MRYQKGDAGNGGSERRTGRLHGSGFIQLARIVARRVRRPPDSASKPPGNGAPHAWTPHYAFMLLVHQSTLLLDEEEAPSKES